MSNSYFFIPGRNRELSLAEFKSVIKIFSKENINIIIDATPNEYILLKTDLSSDVVGSIFKRLGGFIKYGELIDLESDILSFAQDKDKLIFGVSGYHFGIESNFDLTGLVKDTLKMIKRTFKESGISSRFIGGGTRLLTSGQIEGNHLLDKGFEMVILLDKDNHVTFGKTLAIQDIEAFSERDYDKPFVDLKMGVIPPKLARMMINLCSLRLGETIWDPFCGSGNILIEALLLGYNVLGSDIDPGSVNASKQNIEWLSSKNELGDVGYNVFKHDVTKLDKRLLKRLQETEFSAIVFEPYMGPPQRQPISTNQAANLIEKTVGLYSGLLDTLEHSKKRKLKMVSVFPSYKTHRGWMTKRYNEIFSHKWKVSSLSEDLHWERSNSIIRRNLIIAEYNN